MLLFLASFSLKDDSTVRLIDGPYERPNIGRVQVQYDDTLTDVCFEGNRSEDILWNWPANINLKVLCKQLGYPGALMTSSIKIQNDSSLANIFTDDYKCGYAAVYGKLLDL